MQAAEEEEEEEEEEAEGVVVAVDVSPARGVLEPFFYRRNIGETCEDWGGAGGGVAFHA